LNQIKKTSTEKGVYGEKDGYLSPIISTPIYIDSHQDVHFDGCFNKTVVEQNGKVKYILDHSNTYENVLAWSKDVNMLVKQVPWGTVGKQYSGNTEALVFEISKDKFTRKDVLADIENKVEDFENSISMIYYKIVLGMESDDKAHRAERDYYERRKGEIVNSEELDETPFFWGVEELGIYKEGSLVVAGGSNDATRIFNPEAVTDTSIKIEPSYDTQKTIEYIKQKKFFN
jgi:hypothetical protein